MKNKNWDLVIIIFAILTIGGSFVGNSETTDILGFEMNIWVYRAIWVFICTTSFFRYRKKRKLESDTKM